MGKQMKVLASQHCDCLSRKGNMQKRTKSEATRNEGRCLILTTKGRGRRKQICSATLVKTTKTPY